MAQPNIAREPSMDEILASIRKIIESNEPGMPGLNGPGFVANDRGQDQSNLSRRDGNFDDRATEDIHLTIEDEVSAFDVDEPARDVVSARREASVQISVKPQIAPMAPPPLSLADVAARVRAASERHSSSPPFAKDNENTSRDERETVSSPKQSSVREARSTLPVANLSLGHDAGGGDDAAYPSQPQIEMERMKHHVSPELEGRERPAARNEAGDRLIPFADFDEQQTLALVSPSVGEQVARSFDELALAVDGSPRRSFDEIAQEMMRPMLQEWLDDNLPTLVERLVREEIERVARGPRR